LTGVEENFSNNGTSYTRGKFPFGTYYSGQTMKKIVFSLCLVMASLMALGVPLSAHAPPNTPPAIGTPVVQPSSPTYNAPVKVSVNVTDQHSSVQNVTIIYTTDNWKMVNKTLLALYNTTTTTATDQIPALANGGHVAIYVVAFNGNGIRGVNNNSGSYFGYDVAAPPTVPTTTNGWIATGIILGSLGAFAVVALHILRKKPGTSSQQTS